MIAGRTYHFFMCRFFSYQSESMLIQKTSLSRQPAHPQSAKKSCHVGAKGYRDDIVKFKDDHKKSLVAKPDAQSPGHGHWYGNTLTAAGKGELTSNGRKE